MNSKKAENADQQELHKMGYIVDELRAFGIVRLRMRIKCHEAWIRICMTRSAGLDEVVLVNGRHRVICG